MLVNPHRALISLWDAPLGRWNISWGVGLACRGKGKESGTPGDPEDIVAKRIWTRWRRGTGNLGKVRNIVSLGNRSFGVNRPDSHGTQIIAFIFMNCFTERGYRRSQYTVHATHRTRKYQITEAIAINPGSRTKYLQPATYRPYPRDGTLKIAFPKPWPTDFGVEKLTPIMIKSRPSQTHGSTVSAIALSMSSTGMTLMSIFTLSSTPVTFLVSDHSVTCDSISPPWHIRLCLDNKRHVGSMVDRDERL